VSWDAIVATDLARLIDLFITVLELTGGLSATALAFLVSLLLAENATGFWYANLYLDLSSRLRVTIACWANRGTGEESCVQLHAPFSAS
jgi:hypothetical protein